MIAIGLSRTFCFHNYNKRRSLHCVFFGFFVSLLILSLFLLLFNIGGGGGSINLHRKLDDSCHRALKMGCFVLMVEKKSTKSQDLHFCHCENICFYLFWLRVIFPIFGNVFRSIKYPENVCNYFFFSKKLPIEY